MQIITDTSLSIGFIWAITIVLGIYSNNLADNRNVTFGYMVLIAIIASTILLIIALLLGWIWRLF